MADNRPALRPGTKPALKSDPRRELIRLALSDPEEARRQLDQADGEESLLGFVRLMWHALEPASRAFVEGWAVGAICEHLEAVHNGQIKRLLVTVPPGSMKSLATAAFFPAWEWGPRNQAHMRYLCASYADPLSIRDNRRCRNVIRSARYQELWGERFRLVEDQNAKVRYDTDKTGYKIATSVGGIGTGERGDRVIVDDAHSVKKAESEADRNSTLQWFTEVLPTRIMDPDLSAIIVIGQRVHEQDVAGLILEKELGYDHLCIPFEFEVGHPYPSRTALGWVDPRTEDGELFWPERYSRDFLERTLKPQMQAIGGDHAVAGQLQQRPTPRGGGLCKADRVQILDDHVGKGRRVRGWDLAASKKLSADFTVGVKLCQPPDGRLIVEDVVRTQAGPDGVRALIKATAARDGPGVEQALPQDPGQAGLTQRLDMARLLQGHLVRFSPESGDKVTRFEPFAAQWNAGNVWLARAPWNDGYLAELTTFPRGRHDDQADGTSRAYGQLLKARSRVVGAAPQGGRQGE